MYTDRVKIVMKHNKVPPLNRKQILDVCRFVREKIKHTTKVDDVAELMIVAFWFRSIPTVVNAFLRNLPSSSSSKSSSSFLTTPYKLHFCSIDAYANFAEMLRSILDNDEQSQDCIKIIQREYLENMFTI